MEELYAMMECGTTFCVAKAWIFWSGCDSRRCSMCVLREDWFVVCNWAWSWPSCCWITVSWSGIVVGFSVWVGEGGVFGIGEGFASSVSSVVWRLWCSVCRSSCGVVESWLAVL